MKVAVIGSWKKDDAEKWKLKDEGKFLDACIALGKEIAMRGHSLLVTSDKPDTSDYGVVNGFVEQIGNVRIRRPLISVYRSSGSEEPFKKLKENQPTLFNIIEENQPEWISNILFSVRDADSVIAIGGGGKTNEAALSALIANKRLVPIGSFGGASQGILQKMRNMHFTQIDLTGLDNSWDSSVLNYVLNQSGIIDYPKIFIIHGSSNDWQDLYCYLQKDPYLPKPIVMQIIYGESQTLPEHFEELASRADGAITVVTPDDIGGKIASESGEVIEENYRARQNVWLEIGWFWGKLGRKHFLILKRGRIEIEQPSDLQGIKYSPYLDKPSEKHEDIDSFIRLLRYGS